METENQCQSFRCAPSPHFAADCAASTCQLIEDEEATHENRTTTCNAMGKNKNGVCKKR